jgi:DedD protein
LNQAMKQRLVGAIVLGCLAIIFIPILLDGEGVSPTQITLDIPSTPVTPAIPQIEPVRPIVLSDTDELDLDLPLETTETVQPLEEPRLERPAEIVEVSREERPSLGVQGLPESWSVRLASFGDKDNAEGLLSRLLDDSYSGYSRQIDSSQGQLTAIFVGPVLSQTEASRLQSELEEKFNLSGIVVQFTIEEMAQ